MPESETLLKVLLVDDEPFITKGLAVLVDWNALGFAIEGAVSNGRQALTFLKKHPVDLIIADIQMPVMDGLELLEIIQRDHLSDAYFVILSGYSDFEYARQAIRFDCMEYLLKPVDEERLAAAMDRYLLMHRPPERLFLQTGSRGIPLEDILYLEIAGRKTAVYTVEEQELISRTLSSLEDSLLTQGFCHSHFSYLVNLAHVKRVTRTAILLDNGDEIPVSRRYYQQFMDRYIEHLK